MKPGFIKKVVSIIVVVTFFATNTTYATSGSRSLFRNKKVDYKKLSTQYEQQLQKKKSIFQEGNVKTEHRKRQAKRILSGHLKDLSRIHIPPEIGRVIEVYKARNPEPGAQSPLIVHIQDLHTNPEAQYNLAKILELLIKDYNLDLVCSEGADGEVDTSSVSSFPDYEVRNKTARLFVNSGELTGEEYLSITKYPKLPIWGIEDRNIYFENIIQFNRIMKFNPQSQVFISQTKKVLEQLKPKIYSKALLELDQKEAEYENKKIETDEYLQYLTFYLKRFNIPTSRYKNINLLVEAIQQEKNIDQQKIMQESRNLLLNLQATLSESKDSRSEIDSLMVKAELFKEQKISPFSFYSYLKDLALKYLPDKFSNYSGLNNFIDYLTKINSVDTTKLFVEMRDLTYEIKQRLARNKKEKLLTQAIRNIKFLEGFFNLKVSNEELDYYLENREFHKVGWFKEVIRELEGGRSKVEGYIDYNPAVIDDHLQELEDFYDIVKQRDVAMVDNAILEIEKRHAKVAALISGGFHTKGITHLLRDRGYSYIVISPYSSTDIDEENYHFLLSGRRKPITELISQLDETLRVIEAFCPDRMVDEWNRDVRFRVAEVTGQNPKELKIVKGRYRFCPVLLDAFFARRLRHSQIKDIARILSGWQALQSYAKEMGLRIRLNQKDKAFITRFIDPLTQRVKYIRTTKGIPYEEVDAKYFTGRMIDIAGIKTVEPTVSGKELAEALGVKPGEPVEFFRSTGNLAEVYEGLEKAREVLLPEAQKLLDFLDGKGARGITTKIGSPNFTKEDVQNYNPLVLALGSPSPEAFVNAAKKWDEYSKMFEGGLKGKGIPVIASTGKGRGAIALIYNTQRYYEKVNPDTASEFREFCDKNKDSQGKNLLSEAKVIRFIFTHEDVPEDVIYLEEESSNTLENIEKSYDLIKDKIRKECFNKPEKPLKILIVADAFHRFRALLTALAVFRGKQKEWKVNAEPFYQPDLNTMDDDKLFGDEAAVEPRIGYLKQWIGDPSNKGDFGEIGRYDKYHLLKDKKGTVYSDKGYQEVVDYIEKNLPQPKREGLKNLLAKYIYTKKKLRILGKLTSFAGSKLFWPKLEFNYDSNIREPFNPGAIHPSRNAQEVLGLLRKAEEKRVELSIIGHLRGADGCGSSLDLPEFQKALTKAGAKLEELPSTPTIASDFTVKIRFELAKDPESIEYIALDYGIPENKPYSKRKVELTSEGRTPEGQKDAPAYIFGNLFGLRGIRIVCEKISPMALAGGMESSNVFNIALISAASILSGANLSLADIFSLAVRLENNEFGGLTGGQGHLCYMLGGAYRHIWLSGKEGVYGAFSIPLLPEEQLSLIERHTLLVQAGKEYKNGKEVKSRAAKLTNEMWTDLLRDKDKIGLPLHEEKLGLTAKYTQALEKGDFDTVVKTVIRYVEIRDALCKRWLSLAIGAHKKVSGLPSYAYKYADKVFNKNHPEYKDYELVRELYDREGDNLKDISLYTLDPISSLIRQAKEEGIAIMPLGAGGPGANLIAISAKGVEHIKKFLEARGIKELTENTARGIIRGTGVLKGYMPFKVGKEPLEIIGFDKLGLKPPQGPRKVDEPKSQITINSKIEVRKVQNELARKIRQVVVIGGGSGTNFFSKPIENLGWNDIRILTPFDTGGRTGRIKNWLRDRLSEEGIEFFAVGDITKVLCEYAPLEAVKRVMNTRLTGGGVAGESNFTRCIKDILNTTMEEKISGSDSPQFTDIFVNRLIASAKKVDEVFEGLQLKDHSVRHLIYASLILYRFNVENKSYQQSIDEGTEEFLTILGIDKQRANAFLSSVDPRLGTLVAKLKDRDIRHQDKITKEKNLGIVEQLKIVTVREEKGRITEVSNITEVNRDVTRKLGDLEAGDILIIGPGSFYTSKVANLLPHGIISNIKEAKKRGVICVFVLNPIFEYETIGMKGQEEGVFVHMLEKVKQHTGVDSIGELFDYVIANDALQNSPESIRLMTEEGSIEADPKFERFDKRRLGAIGENDPTEIFKLASYLKGQEVSLITGDLMEVVETFSEDGRRFEEATFSPSKFQNILKAITQDHVLSKIAEIIVISDPHATIDGLVRMKKSIPGRHIFVVGDLVDRGDEIWSLLRLVDRFVIGDHEGWVIGAGLGYDYLLALWLRSLYRYPATTKILEELGIRTASFKEFAEDLYDKQKLEILAGNIEKKYGEDKYKGPKTPAEQAMFNIWIKLALQEDDKDAVNAIEEYPAEMRRYLLLRLTLSKEEDEVLKKLESRTDEEVKKIAKRLRGGAYIEKSERSKLLDAKSLSQEEKRIIRSLIIRSNRTRGKEELQKLTEGEEKVFGQLKEEFLMLRPDRETSVANLLNYFFRGGIYDIISPLPVLNLSNEELKGIDIYRPGRFPRMLVLHALPPMKKGLFVDLYGEPLNISLKEYYDQLSEGMRLIANRYREYIAGELEAAEILEGEVEVAGRKIRLKEFLRLLVDSEYAPLFSRQQTRTHTYIDVRGEPDNETYMFMSRNYEVDKAKATLNKTQGDKKEILTIRRNLKKYGIYEGDLKEEDGFLYLRNEGANKKILKYVLQQFGADVLVTGHKERDKAHKPVKLAGGRLWIIDPGFAKKSGEVGARAATEYGGGIILTEGAYDRGIRELVLVKPSDILKNEAGEFDREKKELITLLNLKDMLYYSNSQLGWDELYNAPYLVQDLILVLNALGKGVDAVYYRGDEVLSMTRSKWIEYYNNLSRVQKQHIVDEIKEGVVEIISQKIKDEGFFNQSMAQHLKQEYQKLKSEKKDPRITARFHIRPKGFVMPVCIDGKLQLRTFEVKEIDKEIIEDFGAPTLDQILQKETYDTLFKVSSLDEIELVSYRRYVDSLWERNMEANLDKSIPENSPILKSTRQKFDINGNVLPFHGITTFATWVDRHSNLFKRLVEFKRDLQKELREAGLGDKFAFVDESTYHITLSDLIWQKQDEGEEDVNKRIEDQEIIKKVTEAFIATKTDTEPTFEIKGPVMFYDGGVLILRAYPKRPEDLEALKKLRKSIEDKTDIRSPYPCVFHITLAYLVGSLEKEEWNRVVEILGKYKDMGYGNVTAGEVELLYFNSMEDFISNVGYPVYLFKNGEVKSVKRNIYQAKRSQRRLALATEDIPEDSSSRPDDFSQIERGVETPEVWRYFKRNGTLADAKLLANEKRVDLRGRSQEVLNAAYDALSMLYASYLNVRKLSEVKDKVILFYGDDVLDNEWGFVRALGQLGENQIPVVLAKDRQQEIKIQAIPAVYNIRHDFRVMTLKEAGLEGFDFNRVMNEDGYGIDGITNLRFVPLSDVLKYPEIKTSKIGV